MNTSDADTHFNMALYIKAAVSWAGTGLGYVLSYAFLAKLSLLLSIVYTSSLIYVHFRDKVLAKPKGDEA